MTTAGLLAVMRAHFDGQPWYGSAVRKIVSGVAAERAFTRPAPEVRSVAELLAHLIAWIDIVEERLRGVDASVTPERDFPSVDGVAWDALCARLDEAHARLLATVATKTDADWSLTVRGKSHTYAAELQGLLHHNTYHAAQIAIVDRITA